MAALSLALRSAGSHVKAFAVIVALLAIPGRADAQATNAGWQFEFTPYAWYAGIKGTARDDDLPDDGISIEQNWSDLFAKLERALMGSFEARKGRWGGMVDGVDFRIRGGGTVTGSRGFTSLTAEGSLAQMFYSAAASYRARTGNTPIDIMGGARYAMVDWNVDIELAIPPISSGQLKSQHDWIDPYLGARIQQPISKRWVLTGYGDVGGFGVGSRLSMQGLATARFAFTSWLGGSLAYRAISEDYDKDGFKYDMINAGPMLGLSFRW
jgi:hypothetical protein